jgi:hypothetical protein
MATPTTLPATFTAGQVLTAAQMNDLRGAFRVLQVVYFEYGGPQVSSSSSTFSDTGITATITPSSTSSKVLVITNHAGCFKNSSNTHHQINLLRGSTIIAPIGRFGGADSTTGENGYGTVSSMILDSPATTSATTYKTQHASYNNTAVVGFGVLSPYSTMILMEISA